VLGQLVGGEHDQGDRRAIPILGDEDADREQRVGAGDDDRRRSGLVFDEIDVGQWRVGGADLGGEGEDLPGQIDPVPGVLPIQTDGGTAGLEVVGLGLGCPKAKESLTDY
jgi:hypothetical protein